MGLFVFASTILAIAIGSSFQFGYQTGVPNEPLPLIESFIGNVSARRSGGNATYSDEEKELISTFIVGGFPIGGLFGALMAGYLANRFGRKNALLLLAVPSLLGSSFMFMGKFIYSFEVLIIGRLLIGAASGAYTGIAPTYMSEVAPEKIKGAAGSIAQLACVIALLLSQVLGQKFLLGTDSLWPYLFGFSAIPTIIQLLTLPFCPESPFYLIFAKRDEQAAKEALQKLRGTDDVSEEINLMKTEADRLSSTESLTVPQLIRRSDLRRALIVAVGLHIAQQLSGINAVIYYSGIIFDNAGLKGEDVALATLGMGSVNVLVTVVSTFIVDRAGRRSLLLVGFIGMFCMTLLLTIGSIMLEKHSDQQGWSYLCIGSTYGFVAFFATGPGSIPWFYVAEIFTNEGRGAAITICVGVNWLCNCILALGFVHLIKLMGGYNFLPFAGILLAAIIFIWFLMPESKGRTPEEMMRLFQWKESQKYARLGNEASTNEVSGDFEGGNNASISFNTRSMLQSDQVPVKVVPR